MYIYTYTVRPHVCTAPPGRDDRYGGGGGVITIIITPEESRCAYADAQCSVYWLAAAWAVPHWPSRAADRSVGEVARVRRAVPHERGPAVQAPVTRHSSPGRSASRVSVPPSPAATATAPSTPLLRGRHKIATVGVSCACDCSGPVNNRTPYGSVQTAVRERIIIDHRRRGTSRTRGPSFFAFAPVRRRYVS